MALYYSKGKISEMSEVQSGTSKSGSEWQRMTLTLDVPGYQGSVTKQVFQVFGDSVDDVQEFHVGDLVEIGWSMYAREWNGRMYNNVDLVKISEWETNKVAPAVAAPKTGKIEFAQDDLNPESHKEDLPF